jgi:gliding motility-associated-like protein
MVYYVEAANPFGCISARTPANANVTPLPQLSVQGSSVCPGSTAMLSATADVPNYTINWYSSASGGTPVYTGNAFTIPSLSSNLSYYAEAINNVTGCVSASRALVQATVLQPLPAPVVTVSNIARTSITFSWSAVADAIGYQVSTDNGASYSDPSTGSTGLSHTVSGLSENQTVNILVRAIGNSGCQLSGNSTAVSAVTENFSTDIYIANAFTPNGDGKNDVVYVHGGGIKTLNFCVYSQWGELLFNSHAITEGWDGTYKGAREPAGVYVYYLKAVLNSGEPVTRKGTITLLR